MSAAEAKRQVNIRLSPEGRKILVRLSGLYGVSQGDIMEILLRLEAARLRLDGFEHTHLKPYGT